MHGVVSCTQIGQQKPSCSIANGGLVIDLQRDPFKRRTVEAEDHIYFRYGSNENLRRTFRARYSYALSHRHPLSRPLPFKLVGGRHSDRVILSVGASNVR